METKTLYKISYGMYLVSSKKAVSTPFRTF